IWLVTTMSPRVNFKVCLLEERFATSRERALISFPRLLNPFTVYLIFNTKNVNVTHDNFLFDPTHRHRLLCELLTSVAIWTSHRVYWRARSDWSELLRLAHFWGFGCLHNRLLRLGSLHESIHIRLEVHT